MMPNHAVTTWFGFMGTSMFGGIIQWMGLFEAVELDSELVIQKYPQKSHHKPHNLVSLSEKTAIFDMRRCYTAFSSNTWPNWPIL